MNQQNRNTARMRHWVVIPTYSLLMWNMSPDLSYQAYDLPSWKPNERCQPISWKLGTKMRPSIFRNKLLIWSQKRNYWISFAIWSKHECSISVESILETWSLDRLSRSREKCQNCELLTAVAFIEIVRTVSFIIANELLRHTFAQIPTTNLIPFACGHLYKNTRTLKLPCSSRRIHHSGSTSPVYISHKIFSHLQHPLGHFCSIYFDFMVMWITDGVQRSIQNCDLRMYVAHASNV